MNTVIAHKHFTFGVAPFRFVGIWSAPSKALCEQNPSAYNAQLRSKPDCCHFSCEHCGTPIVNHCIIIDATGERFAVGTDCVLKTTHTEIISRVKLAQKAKAKAVRAAKKAAEMEAKRAAHEAALQAQRDANGGLTDAEVEHKKAMAARREQLAIVSPIVTVLRSAGGSFCYSIADGYNNGIFPRGRAKEIVIEIMAKQSGRKGSLAYNAALPEAEALVCRVEAALAR